MGFVAALFALLVGIVVAVVVWQGNEDNHVNRLNDQFAKHCVEIGGYPVVNIDKDVCIAKSQVLDHE